VIILLVLWLMQKAVFQLIICACGYIFNSRPFSFFFGLQSGIFVCFASRGAIVFDHVEKFHLSGVIKSMYFAYIPVITTIILFYLVLHWMSHKIPLNYIQFFRAYSWSLHTCRVNGHFVQWFDIFQTKIGHFLAWIIYDLTRMWHVNNLWTVTDSVSWMWMLICKFTSVF
jgi:hypothetical protein